MTQYSMVWGGTVTGDAAAVAYGAPYSDDEFSDMLAMLFTYDRTAQGVINTARAGYTGMLAVTNPAGVTIRVATGIAMVDGKLYFNDANVDNVIVAPGAGTNYYRIVLQKTFAAQTVRVAMLGPSLVSTPALTQVDGTIWEISLAGIQITSAGAITVTDERDYIGTLLPDNTTLETIGGVLQIKDAGVSTAKIADDAVTADKIANRTRTLFVPIVYTENETDAGVPCDYSTTYNGWIMLDGKHSHAYVDFKVPADYVSDGSISWIAMSVGVTGKGYVGYDGGFTSPGATWGAGTGYSGGLGTGEPMTENVVTELFNDGIGAVSAGDVVYCNFVRIATNPIDTLDGAWLIVYGLVFSYTADC